MKKYIILLPTCYNDGTEVPEDVINGIKREIDETFDGHAMGPPVEGTYRMADGSLADDVCLQVWVALDEKNEGILREMVKVFAGRLKQESIYFEATNSKVEFIKPDDEGEGTL